MRFRRVFGPSDGIWTHGLLVPNYARIVRRVLLCPKIGVLRPFFELPPSVTSAPVRPVMGQLMGQPVFQQKNSYQQEVF